MTGDETREHETAVSTHSVSLERTTQKFQKENTILSSLHLNWRRMRFTCTSRLYDPTAEWVYRACSAPVAFRMVRHARAGDIDLDVKIGV